MYEAKNGKTFLLLFGQYVEMHCAKKPLLAATSTPRMLGTFNQHLPTILYNNYWC